MGAYLIDNPPVRSQYATRTKRPTGAIILHTAESVMDTVGADTGAENVAGFIQRRATPGSYHDLCDADSIVNLVPYHLAAFQDGTGSNPYALSISWACRTTDWPAMSAGRRDAFLRNGAEAFRRQQEWLRANGYPLTPIRRISAAAVTAGQPGICYHGDRDPGRRTDPGMQTFPFDRFAELCADSNQEDEMVTEAEFKRIASESAWTLLSLQSDSDAAGNPTGPSVESRLKTAELAYQKGLDIEAKLDALTVTVDKLVKASRPPS